MSALPASTPIGGRNFEDLRAALTRLPPARHDAAVEDFLAARREPLPLVSEERAVFLATAISAAPPSLQSDLTDFAAAGAAMSRLGASRWFFREEKILPASRLEYRFTDGERTWCDPLNPRRTASFPGEVSVLEGPGWNDFSTAPVAPHRAGRCVEFEVSSAALGDVRRLTVQLPADYRDDDPAQTRYPVLYLLDGDLVLQQGGYAKLIDALGARSGAESRAAFIAVYVPPVDRRTEYRGDPRHGRFFAEELVAAIDRRWRTLARPDARALLGHSRGGLGALHLAVAHPEVFGHCIAVAPAVHDTTLLARVRADSGPRRRFVLVECRYDVRWHGDVALLRAALDAAEHDVAVLQVNGGHNLGTWRTQLGDALDQLGPDFSKRKTP